MEKSEGNRKANENSHLFGVILQSQSLKEIISTGEPHGKSHLGRCFYALAMFCLTTALDD